MTPPAHTEGFENEPTGKGGKGSLPASKDDRGAALEALTDFGEDIGLGLEGASIDEQLTPFIGVLQSNSPQCDAAAQSPKLLDTARAGMLYNTATEQLYDGKVGVEFVAVAREALYTKWQHPRVIGSPGFRGTTRMDDPAVRQIIKERGSKFGALIGSEYDEFKESDVEVAYTQQYNLYGLYGPVGLTADTAQHAVIAFTSTKIKVYQKFFSTANAIRYRAGDKLVTPPLWAHVWRLTSIPDSNSKGNFFNFKLDLISATPTESLTRRRDPGLYDVAKSFYEQIQTGKVKADYSAGDAGEASSAEHIPY